MGSSFGVSIPEEAFKWSLTSEVIGNPHTSYSFKVIARDDSKAYVLNASARVEAW